jgi:hypothetical protein
MPFEVGDHVEVIAPDHRAEGRRGTVTRIVDQSSVAVALQKGWTMEELIFDPTQLLRIKKNGPAS